jgi:clan AA aspartic protease (TIGR02281 family)
MTAANLAKRRAAHMERIKQRWKARIYGLRFRRRFVDAEFEDEFERGLIHRRIARHMSQCGQCAALLDVAPSSPRVEQNGEAQVGGGIGKVRFAKDRKTIDIQVKINGVEAWLCVDTGATKTLLTESLARRAQIQILEDAPPRLATLANGASHTTQHARAQLIVVGNASLRNSQVAVYKEEHKNQFEKTEGLLGLSFLQHFDMRICNGVLELTPLKP